MKEITRRQRQELVEAWGVEMANRIQDLVQAEGLSIARATGRVHNEMVDEMYADWNATA